MKKTYFLGRQINERDLALKEGNLVQDSLNKEISALRNELQRALEEVIISYFSFLLSKASRANGRVTKSV